jgi:hypothetical protein
MSRAGPSALPAKRLALGGAVKKYVVRLSAEELAQLAISIGQPRMKRREADFGAVSYQQWGAARIIETPG